MELAEKGYIHHDLHGRHIGLLPIYYNPTSNCNTDHEMIDLKTNLFTTNFITIDTI